MISSDIINHEVFHISRSTLVTISADLRCLAGVMNVAVEEKPEGTSNGNGGPQLGDEIDVPLQDVSFVSVHL